MTLNYISKVDFQPEQNCNFLFSAVPSSQSVGAQQKKPCKFWEQLANFKQEGNGLLGPAAYYGLRGF